MSTGLMVIVCGGRKYNNKNELYQILDEIDAEIGIRHIIQGEAKGADFLAKQWAIDRKKGWTGCEADWDKHKRSAGPIRNAFMLTLKPDLVLAFRGTEGTENMIEQAIKAGVPTMRVGK